MTTRRFRAIGALLLVLGTSTSYATVVKYEVSHTGLNDWAGSINALPGDSLEVRVLVSYEGTAAHFGFGSMSFQPTLSNWLPGAGGDTLAPFVNGGMGGNITTPTGAAFDNIPGQYGRISPFAAAGETATSFIKGHVNTVSGTTYLRIARAYATNWIGGTGNTTGGGGVAIKQWAPESQARLIRPELQPPAVLDSTNVLVFKFGITLGAGGIRTLIVDTPANGFGNRDTNGIPQAHWHATPSEDVGSIHETITTAPATINVIPAPATVAGLALAALGINRRRR